MACGETVEEVSPMQGGASKEEPDSETDAGAEMDSDTELPLTMPTDERAVQEAALSIDKTYTMAVLRGRHPRSFKNQKGIYHYVNDSNKRANMSSLAKQQPQHHQQQQMVPAPLSILSTGGADGRDHSRCPPPTGGVRVTPHPSLVLEGKNQQSRLGKAATGAYLGEGRGSVIGASPSAGQQQQQQHQEELSPAFSAESCRGLLNVCTAEKLLKRRSKTQQAAVEIDVHQTQHPQALKQRPQQQQQQPPTVGQGNSQQCSGSRRRPRSGISSSRGHRTRPPAPLGQGGGPLGGYTIRQGGPGSLYRADGGDGQAGVGRSGIGHGGQQGRVGDRPATIHQRFNAMMGIHREVSAREEEVQLLDSLNDDTSLRLHYGLHITLQSVHGENGSFMAIDMDTGELTMKPLQGLGKDQQVTFKLIDLEDPESYRSIIYGRSVWLQIVPGPGDPTWKQGGVVGARVHGPGMLPTVVIDPSGNAGLVSAAHPGGGHGVPSRSGTRGHTACASPRPGSSIRMHGNRGNAAEVPRGIPVGGGGGGWAEASWGAGNSGRGGAGAGMSSAVGGGNTDPNRPVGLPYPFKAAAAKVGESGGTTSDTVMRLVNKNAMVNCRWTVRPVCPDGQAVPAKAGHEVSNMDCIYLEQDFFYMTRVSQNASVVLKALLHKPRHSGTPSGNSGTRGSANKHFPVERRGVFRVQVADADELRPGEERSAALMRKAKRGLKRSEARRGGHRTYVHTQRPEEKLASGAAFPREIRIRTTHFATESESRAILSRSPPRAGEGGAERSGADARGAEGPGYLAALSPQFSSASASSWIPTGSWGTKILQAMSDAARASPDAGVAASHASVLRKWRRRWGDLGVSATAEAFASGGASIDSLTNHRSSFDNSTAFRVDDVSPMCLRCRHVSSNPLVPVPPVASTDSLPSTSEPVVALGRYCLCSVNQDIQREVLQDSTSGSHKLIEPPPHGSLVARGVGNPGDELGSKSADGRPRPPSPAMSAKSSSGGTVIGGDQPGDNGAGARSPSRPGSPDKGGAGRLGSPPPGDAGAGLTRGASAHGFVESGVSSGTAAGLVAGAGLKRTRDRRADRRKKKDPFEALEERLLDGFSLESILRQLERQDETLQKGVRHVERMDSRRREPPGRRPVEDHQRFLAMQKNRLEAVASDSLPEPTAE